MWSIWISPGFYVEFDNLAGLSAKEFHLESMKEGKDLINSDE
jgi:hypothetical protein